MHVPHEVSQSSPRPILPQLLAARAAEEPNRPFIETVTGQTETYGQFHDNVLRWANAFVSLGVKTGDRVATLIPTSPDAYHCWLGISWAGALEVPVNDEYKGNLLAYV